MKKLTLDKVKEIIKEIEESKWDDETAHCLEDGLFYTFVENILKGNYETNEEIETIAKELYKVRGIDFERWHA